jgi:hypothetical protein
MRNTKEALDCIPMEPMSSPDLDGFHLADDVEIKQFDSPMSLRSTPEKKAAKGRKRGRSSVDLQQNVRPLLHSSRSVSHLAGNQTVLPDHCIATSFLLPGDHAPTSISEHMGLQSPTSTVAARRMPVAKEFGRKRSCCASEARQVFGDRTGPGMWEGVL